MIKKSASLQYAVRKKEKGKFRALSEASLERRLHNFLKLKGVYQFKVVKSSRIGTPDRILCVNGKFVGIEVKREDGVLSDLQKHHALEIKKNNGLHFELRPSNWNEFLVWFGSL